MVQSDKLLAARKSTHVASIVAFADQEHEKFRFIISSFHCMYGRCKTDILFFDHETHTQPLFTIMNHSWSSGCSGPTLFLGAEEQ